MPRVGEIVPGVRAEPECRRSRGDKGCVVAAAPEGNAGKSQPQIPRNLVRCSRQPSSQVLACIDQTLRADASHPSRTVILIEYRLDLLDDVGMILHERPGSVQTLLLTAPVTDDNRPLRVGIVLLQNSHRLHHRQCPRPVIGRTRRAVPGIEMRREDHVLVRLLGPADHRNGVERRSRLEEFRFSLDSHDRVVAIFHQAIDEVVVLKAERNDRNLLCGGAEDPERAPSHRPLGAQHADRSRLLEHFGERILSEPCFPHPISPRIGHPRPERFQTVERHLRAELLPVVIRPPRGLRLRDEDELPFDRRKPLLECKRVGDVGENDQARCDASLLRGGTPGEHHSLE